MRRNCPWTEAEHRLFLLGLEKYGRGSWRNIAAEFVTTRTATQLRSSPVASHVRAFPRTDRFPGLKLPPINHSIHVEIANQGCEWIALLAYRVCGGDTSCAKLDS